MVLLAGKRRLCMKVAINRSVMFFALLVVIGCRREVDTDAFSATSIAGIELGESISEYIDVSGGIGVGKCISEQGQVDLRCLKATHSTGATKICGILVEQNSGRIARVRASFDGWEGDETRAKAKYAELCKRYADESAVKILDTKSNANYSLGYGEIDFCEWLVGSGEKRALHRVVLVCEGNRWSIQQQISNVCLMRKVVERIAARDAEIMKKLEEVAP